MISENSFHFTQEAKRITKKGNVCLDVPRFRKFELIVSPATVPALPSVPPIGAVAPTGPGVRADGADFLQREAVTPADPRLSLNLSD